MRARLPLMALARHARVPRPSPSCNVVSRRCGTYPRPTVKRPPGFPRSWAPFSWTASLRARYCWPVRQFLRTIGAMTKLQLSLATGDYDRTRPLLDGSVPIDGVAPVIMTLSPEEIFFRAFRHAEFDICELSLSSFAIATAA